MMGIKRKIPFKFLGFTGVLTITVLVLHISFSITSLQTNHSIFQNPFSEGVSYLKTLRLNPQNKSNLNILSLVNETKNLRQDSIKLSVVSNEKSNVELTQTAGDDNDRTDVSNSEKEEKRYTKLTNVVKKENIITGVSNPVNEKQTNVGSTKSVREKTHVKSESPKEEAGKSSVNPKATFVKCDKGKKGIFSFEKDAQTYFEDLGHGLECYVKGTNRTATLNRVKQNETDKSSTCSCLPGYFGDLCSIPSAVWLGSPGNRKFPIKRRLQPRRIINGLPFHHELDMLSARFDEIGDVTDAFILTESNYTAFGEAKPLWLQEKLNQGYASEIQKKIMYILLDWFPEGGRANGWVADEFSRHYLGLWGLPCLADLHDEDIFVLSDADELPSREVVTFLKLHDGFPEPIAFSLRWTIFGFFWRQMPDDVFKSEKLTTRNSAVTVKTLREFLNSNAYKIRQGRNFDLAPGELGFRTWGIGVPNFYAGWHCSWCFDPQGIVEKLNAAQSDDGPRWGNYPEKKKIPYIKELIRKGRWFDDEGTFLATSTTDAMYAPSFFLHHPNRYRFLLQRPNHNVDKEKKRNNETKVEDNAKEV